MPIPAQRIIIPTTTRNFGRFGDAVEVPDLTDVQTRSYDRFLQLDVPYDRRARTPASKACCEKSSRSRATTRRSSSSTSSTTSASRATTPTSAASSA